MAQIYVDMDGVLAVWNEKASEEETHEPGYFINREQELSSLSLVRILKDKGFDVQILSSVYEDDHSIEEKRKWLDNAGLSDIDAIFVPYGEKKDDYISPTGTPVLIDDYTKNLRSWEAAGYIPIKFMNGINNRPKVKIDGDVMKIELDSWDGFSIDRRMTPMQMYTIVSAVVKEQMLA